MHRTNDSIPATCCTNRCVFSGDWFCRYSASTGTNACENAPSAKMRRKRLGRRKATTKASIAAPAPKTRATTASRIKPNTRESIVMLLNRAKTASKFMVYLSKYKGAKFNMKRYGRLNRPQDFYGWFLLLLGGHEKVQAALVGKIKLRERVFIVAAGGFISAKIAGTRP